MLKASSKLCGPDDALAVTIPRDLLEAAGFKQGDLLLLQVRGHGVIELKMAVPDEVALEEAFQESLDQYDQVYRDLAK